MDKLENRVWQEMDENVEKHLRIMQQEYQHNADGVQKRQEQVEHYSTEVERRREALVRESARELTILDRELDEVQKMKNELQQQ